MIFLLLAILSSALIALLMRLSTDRTEDKLPMLAVNYLICTVLGAVYADFSFFIEPAQVPVTLGLSLVHGALLLSAFLMLHRCTAQNGIVLSSVFMKLGLIVPMAVSVAVFAEQPSMLQVLGFVLAVGAIVLLNGKPGGQDRLGVSLLLLLLLGGGADVMGKLFSQWGAKSYADLFLCLSFGVAFLLCMIPVLGKKRRPDPKALLLGALIGIPNFFSSKFLLGALGSVPAVVVYPTFSVATMLLVTLGGVVLFRERLRKHQWVALGVIVAALLLLNL